MARRTSRKKAKSTLNGTVIFVFLTVGLVVWLYDTHPVFFFSVLALAVLSPIALAILKKRAEQEESKRKAEQEEMFLKSIHDTMLFHVPALARMKSQLVTTDAYGKFRLDKWEKEKDYFLETQIEPSVPLMRKADYFRLKTTINSMVDLVVEEEFSLHSSAEFREGMNPFEFEEFCAEQLRNAGWDARRTQQSRDQGVDVVAEKSGMRVVLQCKLYSHPVGNKAVQEAAAARAHERAQYGVVVTNHRFTIPAEQLAGTNKILLIHYRELKDLDGMLISRASAVANGLQR